MTSLAVSPAPSDSAWSNALAFSLFDLSLQDCGTLVESEDAKVAFVAQAYSEERESGTFRREAIAVNSEEWAQAVFDAACQKERERGREKLRSVAPIAHNETLHLNGVDFSSLLHLAEILTEASHSSLKSAIISGYYNQPDGSLDDLFTQLDFAYGKSREYFRALALFELSDRVDSKKFVNSTQVYVAGQTIKSILMGETSPPRLIIAAKWALSQIGKLIRANSSGEVSSEHTDVLGER